MAPYPFFALAALAAFRTFTLAPTQSVSCLGFFGLAVRKSWPKKIDESESVENDFGELMFPEQPPRSFTC